MPVRCFILLIVAIASGCKSDVIPCPEVKSLKLREYSIRHVRENKRSEDASTRKVSKRRDPYLFTRAEVLASKTTVEDWDCPKPGAQKKIVKEHKKRMEKRVKSMAKKRANAEFNPFDAGTARQGR